MSVTLDADYHSPKKRSTLRRYVYIKEVLQRNEEWDRIGMPQMPSLPVPPEEEICAKPQPRKRSEPIKSVESVLEYEKKEAKEEESGECVRSPKMEEENESPKLLVEDKSVGIEEVENPSVESATRIVEEPQEAKESIGLTDSVIPVESEESIESKESDESKELMELKKSNESVTEMESTELKETKETKESDESREPMESEKSNESMTETKETKEFDVSLDSNESNESNDFTESFQSVQPEESVESVDNSQPVDSEARFQPTTAQLDSPLNSAEPAEPSASQTLASKPSFREIIASCFRYFKAFFHSASTVFNKHSLYSSLKP